MSTTTEFEIKVPGGRIANAIVMPDGSCKLVMEIQTPTVNDTALNKLYKEGFVRVPASELSLEEDWFKNHQTKTDEEKRFKELVRTAIQRGLKDFYRPKYDPAFNKAGGICYMPCKRPAVKMSYNWWVETANDFMPWCRSRLGTKTEYIAFLAVLIKKLVECGWHVQDAWHAVCNDSKKLGHYWNSPNAKHAIENTGYIEICGFYDLANTCKILAEDEENGGFWLASGNYFEYSFINPLSTLYHFGSSNNGDIYSTGWIVLESSPDFFKFAVCSML